MTEYNFHVYFGLCYVYHKDSDMSWLPMLIHCNALSLCDFQNTYPRLYYASSVSLKETANECHVRLFQNNERCVLSRY